MTKYVDFRSRFTDVFAEHPNTNFNAVAFLKLQSIIHSKMHLFKYRPALL